MQLRNPLFETTRTEIVLQVRNYSAARGTIYHGSDIECKVQLSTSLNILYSLVGLKLSYSGTYYIHVVV